MRFVMGCLKPKPVLTANKTCQVPNQRAMRDERTFGWAGGTTGLDQHRGVVGMGLERHKFFALCGNGLGVVNIGVLRCAVDAHQMFE